MDPRHGAPASSDCPTNAPDDGLVSREAGGVRRLRLLDSADAPASSPRRGTPHRRWTAGPDCVVIGHNDVELRAVEDFMYRTRKQSAAYKDFQANTVNVRGERMTYMSLLNRSIGAATNRDPGLNVCELPQLGSCYLTSYLTRRSFEVEHVNFFNSGKPRFESVLADRPATVAITTTLYVSNEPIKEIVDFVRARSPGTTIIVGGPRVNNICAEFDAATRNDVLRDIGADVYVTDSQGEATLARLVAAVRDDQDADLTSIPNIIVAGADGELSESRSEPESNDLNDNAIDWSHIDRALWIPTVQIRTARSCAFKCAFCRYPIMAGPLHLVSVENLEKELRVLHNAGVRNLVFIDDTFNVPLPRFKNLCRMMIENGFGFNWFSFFRCSNSDVEAFDLMAASGCKGVFLGIESGDPQILLNMNKFADVDRYRTGIRELRARGIVTFACLIVGFPGEDRQSVLTTKAFLEETCPDFYRFEIYYHYTNVPIHQQADRYGINGAGYSWRHNSMSWQQAADHLEELYRGIQGPRVLPGYMFDFWSIPYLMGKGISVDRLKRFTEISQQFLLDGLGDTVPAATKYEPALADVFRC